MKLTFIFIIGMYIFSGFQDCRVNWDERNLLKLSDFRIVDNNNDILTEAKSSIGIEYDASFENDTLSICVRAYFNCSKSYISGNPDSQLLEHENLHFHLAEIYSRKMRKQISSLNVPSEEALDSLFKLYFDSLKISDDTYDRETVKSLDSLKQVEWKFRINNELDVLKEYSNPIVEIAF